MTTTAAVLWDHVQSADLCPGSESLEAWLDVRWIRARVPGWRGGPTIPILPVIGCRNALILHDVHHVVTGYETSLSGEVELAAWELASGSYGWNLFFWIDRSIAALVGALVLPVRTARAFRRGLGCRNLYGLSSRDVLEQDFEDVVARLL